LPPRVPERGMLSHTGCAEAFPLKYETSLPPDRPQAETHGEPARRRCPPKAAGRAPVFPLPHIEYVVSVVHSKLMWPTLGRRGR
jgi:hypothetical protein